MEDSVLSVEKILNYSFTDKRLIEEALTHSSCTDSPSYERLEFLGDRALGLAYAKYMYFAYPDLDQGKMSLLEDFNLSTEKLARVALKHGFYRYLRGCNTACLDEMVNKFSEAVTEEDDAVPYGGSVKAPKFLADLVESVAAAVYIDVNFNLERLWMICKGLLEPMVTPKDLQLQAHPVTKLYMLFQKHGKHIDIIPQKNGIACVYLDGECIATGVAEQKKIARLNAAKAALLRSSEFLPADKEIIENDLEIEGGMKKLHEHCKRNKWPIPSYRLENEEGPSHSKRFVCSVTITTSERVLFAKGSEKTRKRDAENSAASSMIRALGKGNDL